MVEGKVGLKNPGLVSHQEEGCPGSSAPNRLKDSPGFLLMHSVQEEELLLCRKWHSSVWWGEKHPPKGAHPESAQMRYEPKGTPVSASSPGSFVQIIISIYVLFVSLPLIRIQKLNLSAFSMRFSFL